MSEEMSIGEIKWWMILVIGIIFGMLLIKVYDAKIGSKHVVAGADYVEYRMEHLSEIRSIVNDEMTLGELKRLYYAYGSVGASRAVLETEINRVCSGYKVQNQTIMDDRVVNMFARWVNESSRE